jgi:uncharacterized protein
MTMDRIETFYSAFEGLDKLHQVYEELNQQIREFRKIMNLYCLEKCSHCCATPAEKIEASILEMLPLSIYLWERDEAENILKKIQESEPESPYVLFNPNPPDPFRGACDYYSFRPLVCRLFGFSAVFDKKRQQRVALCKPIKQKNPRVEEKINYQIENGLKIPIISDFAQRVSALNPYFGRDQYSVNQSLKQALEIVGYRKVD